MTDRVAFITGASRGVGAAVARAFNADGMRVALASRSGDDLGLGLGLLGLGSGEKFVITGGVLLLAVTVDSLSRRAQTASGRT